MFTDFCKCLKELADCSAFELQSKTYEDVRTDYYIPYMMNDALECFFVLENGQLKGEISPEQVTEIELIETDNFPALIIRQNDGTVATLWFKDFKKALTCYRYHEIGHFWVESHEQWRQLVYIIGTIYDKYQYLGTSICNAEELALLPFMEFAPFRCWSPIHESLDAHYPDTIDGIRCMRKFCIEANDKKLLKLLSLYEKLYPLGIRKLADMIATELGKTGHEALYELIYKKVRTASKKYPARDYGELMNKRITQERAWVAKSVDDI